MGRGASGEGAGSLADGPSVPVGRGTMRPSRANERRGKDRRATRKQSGSRPAADPGIVGARNNRVRTRGKACRNLAEAAARRTAPTPENRPRGGPGSRGDTTSVPRNLWERSHEPRYTAFTVLKRPGSRVLRDGGRISTCQNGQFALDTAGATE